MAPKRIKSHFHFGQGMFSKPKEPSDCNYVCVLQILVISNIEKHLKLSLHKVIGDVDRQLFEVEMKFLFLMAWHCSGMCSM